MNTKPGTSMAQTGKTLKRINSRLDSIAEIEYNGTVAGFSFSGSGPSQAMSFPHSHGLGRAQREGSR